MEYGNPASTWHWPGTGSAWCIANSHLGDRAGLARSLGLASTVADHRLILAAYRKWGPDCAAHLTGPFAFAISDPHRGRLILGRDHAGQVPLFYSLTRSRVVYSIDVEAVLAHPDVDESVDWEAVAFRYARVFGPLRTRSMFRQVAKVAPGTVVTLDREGAREYRYWRPERLGIRSRGSIAEHAEHLRSVLWDAVADALPDEGLVGAHVSGGIDSGAVALIAHRQLRSSGRGLACAFSWAPPIQGPLPRRQDPRNLKDERWLVELVCAAEGLMPRYTGAKDGREPRDAGGGPLIRPTESWAREGPVARSASSAGISVLLSGWGGDEFASHNGRTRTHELARQRRYPQVWREERARSTVTGGSRASAVRGVLSASLPDSTTASLRRVFNRPGRRAGLMHERIRQLWLEYSPVVAEALDDQARAFSHANDVRGMQLALLENGHIAARTETWSKRGDDFGIRYRYPLLDPRVIELALSAPGECFRSGGWTRVMFRLAVSPVLPRDVVWNVWKDEPALVGAAIAGQRAGSAGPRFGPLAEIEAVAARVRDARLAEARSTRRVRP